MYHVLGPPILCIESHLVPYVSVPTKITWLVSGRDVSRSRAAKTLQRMSACWEGSVLAKMTWILSRK